MEPGDHLNVKVGLSGYFFKKFRYTAEDTKKTNKDRLAPLVIGHTLTLLTEPAAAEPPPDSEWVNWLGPTFFAGIGLTVAILFAVGYWFRRGDWRVRGRRDGRPSRRLYRPAPGGAGPKRLSGFGELRLAATPADAGERSARASRLTELIIKLVY